MKKKQQKDKDQNEFNIVMLGQFRTLEMFPLHIQITWKNSEAEKYLVIELLSTV